MKNIYKTLAERYQQACDNCKTASPDELVVANIVKKQYEDTAKLAQDVKITNRILRGDCRTVTSQKEVDIDELIQIYKEHFIADIEDGLLTKEAILKRSSELSIDDKDVHYKDKFEKSFTEKDYNFLENLYCPDNNF